ncbi:zinc-binding alcohol dehydrogenase [Jiangella rhizosphaerae]|uniref:Zinc-binding alcohol dehydrogenase n=2 Tax=Jiangella rhizosphaerae TaxID=2293569 RepID=A0A418KZ58_9ACTN|nr:zinc-binding alcohol dehydrogenase [Jiangella rhizosphaerae]
MRALVLEDYGQLTVQRRPAPRPGPGEALVAIAATGICGSDLHGYTGENQRRHPGQVMGHETVGHVVEYGGPVPDGAPTPGSAVTVNPLLACRECQACAAGDAHLCPRRRVIGVDPTISSAFADFMVAPADNLVPWSTQAAVEHGALVEPLAVGMHAANRGGVRAGDVVLVIGAGPIGQAAVLAAHRLGADTVLVSEPQDARRKLAADLGAQPLDPRSDDVVAAARDLTAGAGVPVVIDAVGTGRSVTGAIDACARGGRCVLVGMGSPHLEVAAYGLSTEERALVGAFCYTHGEFAETAAWAGAHDDLLARLVSRVAPVDEAADQFRGLAAGDDDASKIIIAFAPHGTSPTTDG